MSDTREYKLISWNVNGLRAVLKKEPSFTEIFETINAEYLPFKKLSCKKARLSWTFPATFKPGTTQTERAIRAQRFSREKPLCR